MHRLALALSLTLFAACGSGSSSTPPTTPTPDPDTTASPEPPGDGHTDHTHQEPPTTDVPAEPTPPEPDPAQVKADLLAAEMAAFEKAKPVFDKNCSSCHVMGGRGAKRSTLEHFNMTKYPFGGHHAGEVAASIRKSLGLTGGKATMPKNKPGLVQGDDLAAIAAWADAFDASMAGGAHEGMAGHGDAGGHKH
jgi:mono/diheme cytochrome c family protein